MAAAEAEGWDAVRLRRVAETLGCPLAALHGRFRDLDAVADAWFAGAGHAMVAPVDADFFDRPTPERLHFLIMRWFDALAPHRRVTAAMLRGKLYPGHPHHWAPMIFNLSRTIHWLRDAAGLDATGRRRQIEEIGLTGVFLATLAAWCRDRSDGQEKTRRRLEQALERSDRLLGRLF
jgi:AcrR family transcriptional regulator